MDLATFAVPLVSIALFAVYLYARLTKRLTFGALWPLAKKRSRRACQLCGRWEEKCSDRPCQE
jgi:hypothetical protein